MPPKPQKLQERKISKMGGGCNKWHVNCGCKIQPIFAVPTGHSQVVFAHRKGACYSSIRLQNERIKSLSSPLISITFGTERTDYIVSGRVRQEEVLRLK